MSIQNLTQEEGNRVQTLLDYRLLDNLQEQDFVNIVRVATIFFQTPMAVISLVDKEHLWYKAKTGICGERINRLEAFCHYTVLQKEYLEVPDTILCPLFNDHRLVVQENGIRFYAGAPLINAEGYCLGTLCVFDQRPRQFTQEQRLILMTMARQVMITMELQRREKQLNEEKQKISKYTQLLERNIQEMDQLAYAISHDLKAPVKVIHNLAEWVTEDLEQAPANITENLSLLKARTQRLERLMEGLGSYARAGHNPQTPEAVNVQELVLSILNTLTPATKIKVEIAPDLPILNTHKQELKIAFFHLIRNVIQHNKKDSLQIDIGYKEVNSNLLSFWIRDNDIGIPINYQSKIFGLFKTIKARDEEDHTGVGLAIVKRILAQRGKDITLHSEEGVGSTFMFTWPK